RNYTCRLFVVSFHGGSMRTAYPVIALTGLLLLAAAGLVHGDGETKTDAESIARLVEQLGDDSFDKREAAGKALDKIGAAALPQLRKAATSTDLEVRRRAEELVRTIAERSFVEVRRFTGHTDGAITVAVSPDGKRALSGCWLNGTDRAVRLWDV